MRVPAQKLGPGPPTALAENRTNSTRPWASSVGVDYLWKWPRCALVQGSEAPRAPLKRPPSGKEERTDRKVKGGETFSEKMFP